MKALIVGGAGQLGRALRAAAPDDAAIVSLDRAMLDITDEAAVKTTIASVQPDLIFNAAAYTAVDQAEDDEVAAYAVNAAAVGHLAEAANDMGVRLVHVSTDFVFDGSASTPYPPDAPTRPLSAYGRTKLAGERLAGPDALIVRTAWLYAATGHNFVRTMLGLMRGGEGSGPSEVRVVADQVGTPTYAPGLASALWDLAQQGRRGIYHYTDAGIASWYDFAVAIQEEALDACLLTDTVPVIPIASADRTSRARRPSFSALDKQATYAALGAPAPHWRVSLRAMIEKIRTRG